jgi:hypothetical protein
MTMRRQPRGQTLVEFALALPILVLLLVGLFDLGRAVFAFNTVSNAAREGARIAIIDQNESDIDTRAMQRGVTLGLVADDVDVTYEKGDGSACPSPYALGCQAVVTVTHTYVPATPIIGNITGPISISASTRMGVERTCPNPPTLPVCPAP